jgi:hypothetical protein
MADENAVDNFAQDFALKEHELYIAERTQLIDAARESARTFDKAVLTFGSAVFGFSIAFLKDIAPKPAPGTLKWLLAAWCLFASGLLLILLSFLFSHRACNSQIDYLTRKLEEPTYEKRNHWSLITDYCNYSCVALLFLGLLSWSIFAFDNLKESISMNNVPPPTRERVEKGYVPPAPPARVPQQQPAPPPPAEKK